LAFDRPITGGPRGLGGQVDQPAEPVFGRLHDDDRSDRGDGELDGGGVHTLPAAAVAGPGVAGGDQERHAGGGRGRGGAAGGRGDLYRVPCEGEQARRGE
jgi:hypothetical protein